MWQLLVANLELLNVPFIIGQISVFIKIDFYFNTQMKEILNEPFPPQSA